MEEFVDIAALVFSYVGAIIITYGGARAIIKTLIVEIRGTQETDYHTIRKDFAHKIIYGLDFLIAGDILKTIVAPTREEIFVLGAIVMIRTILGYFLTREIIEFDTK